MALADSTPIGHIVGVQGPVVVISCERLPPLRQALLARFDHQAYLFEVHQHLDEHHLRAVTLHGTAGLTRGMLVYDTGAPLHVPVSADWGPGSYVTVHVFRTAADAKSRPARAIGLAWVGIDPAIRKLPMAFDVPEKYLRIIGLWQNLHFPFCSMGLGYRSDLYDPFQIHRCL